MKIEEIKISELTHPEKNAREHPEAQIREIMRSVKEFGQTRPMVVDDNNVVLIGNGLLEAMKRAGWKTASCVVVNGWDDAKKKKAMLADNRIFAMGRDNADVLAEIIRELGEDELDVPGFDADLLESLRNFDNSPIDGSFAGLGEGGEFPSVPDYSENGAGISDAETPGTRAGKRSVVCPKCGEKFFI